MAGNSIDFTAMVEAMLKPDLIEDGSRVAIWGGRLSADKEKNKTAEQLLADFLKTWDYSGMTHSIWEYSHNIAFTQLMLPETRNLILLERGYVFGKGGGTLQIRRDQHDFSWSFIGSKRTPPAGFALDDFWKENSSCKLRWRRNEKAMLWGEYKEELGRWYDDRVGWAKLNYPFVLQDNEKKNKPRLQLEYDLLMDGGQIAFVWWKELIEHGNR